MSVSEKLKELRRFYPKLDHEDREYFHDLQKAAKRMELYPTFLKHPVTKEIIKSVSENLRAVTNSMILDLDEEGRVDPKLVGQRIAWIQFLEILCPNMPDESLLENDLNNRLKLIKDYYA